MRDLYRPSRLYGPGPPPRKKGGLIFLILLLTLAAAIGWFYFHPNDMDFFLSKVMPGEPDVKSLVLTVNGAEKQIRPGQFLTVHPRDFLSVEGFDSNRINNFNLSLFSPDLDIEVLQKPSRLLDLLGEDAFKSPRQFVIQVRQNKARIVASFYILSSMTSQDWLKRSEGTGDLDKKIHYLSLAAALDPKNEEIIRKLADALDQKGDRQAALSVRERVPAEEQDPVFLKKLLTGYKEAGDKGKLVHTYHRLIMASPKAEAEQYLNELAELHRSNGEYQDAVRTYEFLLGRIPVERSPEILEKILQIYQETDNYPKSVDTLSRLIMASPESQSLGYVDQLARLQEDHGQIKEAVQTYEDYISEIPPEQSAGPLKKLLELFERTKDAPGTEKTARRLLPLLPPEERAPVAGKLARMLKEQDRPQEAADVLEDCLAAVQSADSIPLLKEVLDIYRSMDNYAMVVATYRRLINVSPDQEAGRLVVKLAELQTEHGAPGEAAQTYENFLAEGEKGDKTEILKRLLEIYKTEGDRAKIEDAYRRLISANSAGRAWPMVQELATFLAEQGRIDDAADVYRDFIDKLPREQRAGPLKVLGFLEAKNNNITEAVKAYSEAAELDPEDPNVFLNLARLYQMSGETGRAIEALEAEALDGKRDAAILLELSELYKSRGNLEKYQKYLADALKMEPENLESRLKLAESLLESRDQGEAERELLAVLEKNPENLQARLMLIGILEKKPDKTPLIRQYEYLVEHGVEDKVFKYNLGVLYFQAREYDRAEKMMRAVIKQDPEDFEAHEYLFEIQLAQKDGRGAFKQARELIKLRPDEDGPYEYIFNYLDEARNYKLMLSESRKWIQSRPESIRFREIMALAQIKLGRLSDAAKTYEEIYTLQPGDLEILFNLGSIYEAQGRLNDAMSAYSRILEADPENSRAAEARLRISIKKLESKVGN